METLRYRAAREADDPFFLDVEFQTTWESLGEEDRRRLTPTAVREALAVTHEALLNRPGSQVIIAEDEARRRVGMLWLGVNRNLVTGEDEAWVYNITVLPEFQGRGYGKQLLRHAEHVARKGGFPVLGLMVSSHNERARALYEKLDFQPTNLLMRKTLGGEEE